MSKKTIKKKPEFENTLWGQIKRFWHYIWYDDSMGSYIANLAFAFIFIKFLLFPTLGFLLNNDYPIVAIVSGSMEHKIENGMICTYNNPRADGNLNLDEYWELCGNFYEVNLNITQEEFSEFKYKNGLNIGDVMILYGKNPAKIEVGEVLVFIPGNRRFFNEKGPVIHRVVKKWKDDEGKYHFTTKGDHNPKIIAINEGVGEVDIPEEDVIGVGVVRIPFLGYAKIVLNAAIVTIVSIFN